MRDLALYCLIAPFVVAFLFIATHVLIDLLGGFHREYVAARRDGKTLTAATLTAIVRPAIQFHRDGMARVNSTRDRDALIEALNLDTTNPQRTLHLVGPAGPPSLTVIDGGKR